MDFATADESLACPFCGVAAQTRAVDAAQPAHSVQQSPHTVSIDEARRVVGKQRKRGVRDQQPNHSTMASWQPMTPVTEVDEEETTTTTTTTTTSRRRLTRRSSQAIPPTPRAVEAEARHKQRGRPKRKRETASYLIRACDENSSRAGFGSP